MRVRPARPAQSRKSVSDAAPLRRAWPRARARRQAGFSGYSAFLAAVLQQRVLRAFALGEQRQGLPCDIGLEMRALLMCLEGGLVAEQLIEQELRGIFLRPRDQE